MPLKPLELVQPRIVPAAIHNSLKSLVFSCTVPARYGIGRAKKSLRILKNRLEPFGQLRRLIGEQAEKAWITAPIGAHAPPIPCADPRDPPGFPRPGGFVVFVGEFPFSSTGPTARPTSTRAGSARVQTRLCKRLMSVPGIGPIISSAMVAVIGGGDAFAKGRDFAAWGWSPSKSQPATAPSLAKYRNAATATCVFC